MRIAKNKTLIARGKIKIEGNAEVLGAKKNEFSTEKFIPIYFLDDSEVKINGDYFVVDGCTIPESWKKLVKLDWETLFIYGGTDRGKSTLAAYLANKLDGCWILDLDVGQADVAHPAAMGYGFAKNVISISEVKMQNGFFVGSISPMGRESKCLRGVVKLWKELSKLEGRKIVDTTGWIKGKRAREYKLAKLEIINPDIVASFEGKPECLSDYKLFEVESQNLIIRSREERARIRAANYAKWLKGSKKISLDNFELISGKAIPKEFIQDLISAEVEFVKKSDEYIAICTKKQAEIDPEIIKGLKELYGVEEVFIFAKDELKGIICGLYKKDRYLGMGMLSMLDGKYVIETQFDDFDRIEVGEVRFDGEKEYILRLPL
ncbi:MAG: Clp1/GlmU family protein [Archaeoglobaceae archaeon]